MNANKQAQQKRVPATTEPPRVLYCSSCKRETKHVYNRSGFATRIFVCLECGAEKGVR